MNESGNLKTDFKKSYKDLKVFNLAYDLGLQVHKLSSSLPKFERFTLSQQLRKSAMSIPANIAEGMSRHSSASDIVRFIRFAIGSCSELIVWLNYAHDLGYLQEKEFKKLISQYNEVGKMLRGLLNYWLLKI